LTCIIVIVYVRFDKVVKRCWDSSPERRPEFEEIRSNIDKFYRGYGAKQDNDGYYSQNEVTRAGMYGII